MRDLRVAIVGGGLAGLAAALDCADAGASVALYESRTRLGGATYSVRGRGYWLDNGQHVALRCCTSYRALLRRLGVEDLLEIQPRLRIPVLDANGRTAIIGRTSLPAPLHLAGALLRYSHLTRRERLGAVRAARALQALDPEDDGLDGRTFGDWLRAHGQSKRAISALWNLIALPTLNLDAAEASLKPAAKVFRTGLLDDSDAADVAVPRVPLQQLHGDSAESALRARGAQIELGSPVRRIERDGEMLTLEVGERLESADAVVLAVPHDVVSKLVPDGVVDTAALAGLGSSPIVNVHLHYERRVLFEPFAAALDSPVQWLFDRTSSSGVDRGQLVSISLSGADDQLPRTQDEIVAGIRPAVEGLLPAARGVALLDAAVTKEPRATFRAIPGTAALRPGPRTSLRSLYLAGAWTDTGWPATMEGAVRSGHAAADAVLADASPAARRPTVPVEAVA